MASGEKESLHDQLISFHVPDLRVASALMLGAAMILPRLPAHPSFACPLRTLTGVPCPLCGMTTSVEATVQGDLSAAAAATPAGIMAVAVAAWILLRPPRTLRIPLPVAAFALLGMWVFQLFRFGWISV